MKVGGRWIAVVAVIAVALVGGWIVAASSHAQSGDAADTSSLSDVATSTTAVTMDAYVADANNLCAQTVAQVDQSNAAFSTSVEAAASNTTVNPLQVVNQYLNQYMDSIDGVLGLQNSVLDQLQELPTPPDQDSALANAWNLMSAATVAQNQFDRVLENVVAMYYNAGFIVGQSNLPGGTPEPLSQVEQQLLIPTTTTSTTDASTGSTVLLPSGAVTVVQASSTSSTALTNATQPFSSDAFSILSTDYLEFPLLQTNLNNAASAANGALNSLGLNQCAQSGIVSKNFLSVANAIPNISNDYIAKYASQSSSDLNAQKANVNISLASVLLQLPPVTSG